MTEIEISVGQTEEGSGAGEPGNDAFASLS
jgi:hypothetical protein